MTEEEFKIALNERCDTRLKEEYKARLYAAWEKYVVGDEDSKPVGVLSRPFPDTIEPIE